MSKEGAPGHTTRSKDTTRKVCIGDFDPLNSSMSQATATCATSPELFGSSTCPRRRTDRLTEVQVRKIEEVKVF